VDRPSFPIRIPAAILVSAAKNGGGKGAAIKVQICTGRGEASLAADKSPAAFLSGEGHAGLNETRGGNIHAYAHLRISMNMHRGDLWSPHAQTPCLAGHFRFSTAHNRLAEPQSSASGSETKATWQLQLST
jgi:hypothetical protein